MNEEIEMEMMALESIYGEELKVLDDGKKVKVELYDTSCPDEDAAKRVELTVEFNAEYPEVVPNVSVRSVRGLTRAHVEPLAKMLRFKCEELISQPMVFELGNFIQEWMANGMEDPYAKEATQLPNEVVIEQKKKHGTPVTRENFAAWKEKYLHDMEKANPKAAKAATGELKLTGRQIFDKTMNSVDWELFQDGDFEDDEILPDDDEEEESG